MPAAPVSDLSSQACSRRLRLPLWSTPAIQGTTHRDLASKGTYLDPLSFGVERTLEFTKCSSLHIPDMTVQVQTFGFSKMESFPFAFSVSVLFLLDANPSCPDGHTVDTVLLHLNVPTVLEGTSTLAYTSSPE